MSKNPKIPVLTQKELSLIYENLQEKEKQLFNHYLKEVEEYTSWLREKIDIDHLTDAYNRRKFDKDLLNSITMVERSKKDLSLLMLDLDYFKKINDNFGHQEGDRILINSVEEMRNALRGYEDTIYRYGGEEFAIIIPEITLENAVNIGNRIVHRINRNIFTPDQNPVTMSVGVTNYSNGCNSLEELIKYADWGLYKAKENGRNRVEVYTP